MHKSETHKVPVTQAEDGTRLDVFLAAGSAGLSRTRLKQLVQDGHVRDADGPCLDPSAKVRTGQVFVVTVPASEEAAPVAQQ
ncbi:MAG: S4 domain-containing protein, partial [Rhodospirillales bacterium]